jgi:acetyl-CoA C-acetyltransferase
MGRLSGALATVSAIELGAAAIAAALQRAGVAPGNVDHVVIGQVLQAGQGQNPARQAAVRAGIPMTVPATTVNRVCLSGLDAVRLAGLMITSGEADVVVAGGMESMTAAPYLLGSARTGYHFGGGELVDSMVSDGLTCAFEHVAMGEATERYAAEAGIARGSQDAFAVLSHHRAAAAQREGRLGAEIVEVKVEQRRGSPIGVCEDEGVRPGSTVEALAKLRPAFAEAGTITAGNASPVSDGAAALVVASREFSYAHGLEPLAEIVGSGQVAGPGTSLLHQPSAAIRESLRRSKMALGELDLIEVNEAFAAVVLASLQDLGLPQDIVNVNGGAIALGHPLGMSGARLVLTLAYELGRRGGGTGAAALCGGGGQGEALLLRVAR